MDKWLKACAVVPVISQLVLEYLLLIDLCAKQFL